VELPSVGYTPDNVRQTINLGSEKPLGSEVVYSNSGVYQQFSDGSMRTIAGPNYLKVHRLYGMRVFVLVAIPGTAILLFWLIARARSKQSQRAN